MDGERFPKRQHLKLDFAAIREAGFTVVRTYTTPPDDVVELAREFELKVMADVFYPDWRYLVGCSRREQRRVAKAAEAELRAAAQRFAGNPTVLALSLGNEIPADVLRWFGTKKIASVLGDLVKVAREEDPDQLLTYANYPTAEYLPLDDLDFLTFNVFLERRTDFRKYLTRLHHLAGDRPLVLGEVGLDAAGTAQGEQRQAQVLDWQLETAVERGLAGTCLYSWTDEWYVGEAAVEGWHFGLTREDRSPKPALEVAASWNGRTVRDLGVRWPPVSVVICAYNAEATLDECLEHTCKLDYPNLEILVVDDGSSDATVELALRHPRAKLISIEHAGLSIARNEGFRNATGDLIAYLDSDAYPSPEWPYYLALAMDGPTLGGVGGPNVPPLDDALGAHQVARAPGGPVHVLVSDDRAEHIPGCNMAFWKDVLSEVGGFDPIYTSAGDDVDLCWRVLDKGWEIGFHPAALVWHHRRGGVRPYLRQQRGYGRSEALVEARHPDRFTPAGTARWHGRIYDLFAPALPRQRVYRGVYGTAAYQSVYQGGGYALDLAHQVGIPIAALLLMTAPLGLLQPVLGLPALAALLFIGTLGVVDSSRARPSRHVPSLSLPFRLTVALLHLLQPLVRTWGRARHREPARRDLPEAERLPGPVRQLRGGVLLLPEDRPRADVAASLVANLRRAGFRMVTATGWEDFDVCLLAGPLLVGHLVTSAHPIGSIQLRVRRQLRRQRTMLFAVVALVATALNAMLGAVMLCVAAATLAVGFWRTGPSVREVVMRAAGSP
ncbi:MAG: glycosyltransferase [Actinomycetota bacterium]|nr:glycosyltransferase [Actinomycetota bacterium]